MSELVLMEACRFKLVYGTSPEQTRCPTLLYVISSRPRSRSGKEARVNCIPQWKGALKAPFLLGWLYLELSTCLLQIAHRHLRLMVEDE